ncbi:hypothetical protein F7725_028251 [Dissostichus mawsoni]|uniref:Uncharacterized protein n=1 Tax=Dissostichus mawsoni TaxID=36200 RepID=A0A7J5XFU9_DISMA|nr:hypothetical protein F7725_028251 [Dissostichus mawsoni]
MKTDLSKADKITADVFTNIYLKNYNQISESLGQTAEDVAEVPYSQDHHHGESTCPSSDKHTLHPMTTLKYADPNGDLPIDTFYKMVFEHEKLFNASLNFLKLLRWRSRKSFAMETDKSN